MDDNGNTRVWGKMVVSNAVSIATNTAAFQKNTKTITLATLFTNTTISRATLHLVGAHIDAATGMPILVCSNFTAGIVWSNSVPGVAGTVPFTYDYPGWSPNDVGIIFDTSTGTGASETLNQAQFINQ